MKLFTPEDFLDETNPIIRDQMSPSDLQLAILMAAFSADTANAKFEAWLYSQRKVFLACKKEEPLGWIDGAVLSEPSDLTFTHEARLVDIREIGEERCP